MFKVPAHLLKSLEAAVGEVQADQVDPALAAPTAVFLALAQEVIRLQAQLTEAQGLIAELAMTVDRRARIFGLELQDVEGSLEELREEIADL